MENNKEQVKEVNVRKNFQSKFEDTVSKVNLSEPPKDEKEGEAEVQEEEQKEEKVDGQEQEAPALEKIEPESKEDGEEEKEDEGKDEEQEEEQEEAPPIEEEEKEALPENIESVLAFMKETGGSLEDYVRLNADYSKMDEKAVLREYYKSTKSDLDKEEIDFLIEDKFSYDEELDDEKDIKRKKLAYKEAVGEAKKHLNGLKEKYYNEVKLSSKLPPEAKEAVDFYEQYKKQASESKELAQKQQETFAKQTQEVFNKEFKGFEFNVGEDKYRVNVKDVESVKQSQSDLLNVFSKFYDAKKNLVSDPKGYHKALYAASNPDAIAQHFYEQGAADAIKKQNAAAKNIDMDGRKTNQEYVNAKGVKVKVVSGDNSSKLKIKRK